MKCTRAPIVGRACKSKTIGAISVPVDVLVRIDWEKLTQPRVRSIAIVAVQIIRPIFVVTVHWNLKICLS